MDENNEFLYVIVRKVARKTSDHRGVIKLIYLDYAATTPIRKEALDAFVQASGTYFGNPSSLHDRGVEASDVLEKCRFIWAEMIHGEKDGIYFTSGGTESNQLAVMSLLAGNRERGNHIITTEVEHSSLYNLFKQLDDDSYDVTFLPLNERGVVDVEVVQKAIRPSTVLASIHHGNSEVGFVQPIDKLGKLFHESNIIFHVDCVQTFGHIPIDVKRTRIDSLSISSHKIYGPKGTGLAYINPHLKWRSQVEQTTHENGFRPGTVNVPSIVAFSVAGQLILEEKKMKTDQYRSLRSRFVQRLHKELPQVRVIANESDQLPHIIGLVFPKVEGQYVMLECNKRHIHVSTGSACQVGMQSPSRTLLSIGMNEIEAKQLVRISFGKDTTETELMQCIDVFKELVLENSVIYD